MDRLKSLAAVLLACASVALALALFGVERSLAPLKTDLAELRSIRFGLLDPSNWRDPLASAVARELSRMARDEAARTEVRQAVSDAIARGIEANGDKLIERLRESTPPAIWRLSGIETAIARTMQSLAQSETVRASTQRLTDEALAGLDRPASLASIEAMVRKRLDEALAGQADPQAAARDRARVAKHGGGDRELAQQRLTASIAAGSRLQGWLLAALAIVVMPLLFLAASPPGRSTLDTRIPRAVIAVAALALLPIALALPMIEVEARLIALRIELSGQWLEFHDQVLFYNSKSVWAIAAGLIALGKAGSAAIGVMILGLCAVLPIAKFGALAWTTLRGRAPRSRLSHWLVTSSGKWSMADVFVIAIFMAFIGLNGLAEYQFDRIGLLAPGSESDNATRLGVGLYLFVAHVLIGIALGRGQGVVASQRPLGPP
jgi:hypothetical protein